MGVLSPPLGWDETGESEYTFSGANLRMSAAAARFMSESSTSERRGAARFPIEQEVRYKVYGRNSVETGKGRTLNISSGGVLFTTSQALRAGDRLELSVNWPAQLDNKCPLKLVMTGRIVRVNDEHAAIAIDHYEFRTQGSHGLN